MVYDMNFSMNPIPTNGVAYGLDDEAYHAQPSISKSGLWTLHTKSPAHYRYAEREETAALTLGKAAHCAVLEPERFEKSFGRGPEDRRGNKWKDFEAYCAVQGMAALTEGDFVAACRIRDALANHPVLNTLRTDMIVEPSGFWTDEEHGVDCRVRPDAYSRAHGIIGDLKSAADCRPREFARSVANYGYHVQEAMYSDGWTRASSYPVNGFVFIVIEKKAPFASCVYELDPPSVDEGHAIYRKALAAYAACKKADEWPAYPTAVQPLSLARWAFQETTPEEGE